MTQFSSTFFWSFNLESDKCTEFLHLKLDILFALFYKCVCSFCKKKIATIFSKISRKVSVLWRIQLFSLPSVQIRGPHILYEVWMADTKVFIDLLLAIRRLRVFANTEKVGKIRSYFPFSFIFKSVLCTIFSWLFGSLSQVPLYFHFTIFTGKLVGGFCALSGTFILTLPIPIVVNSFSQTYNNRVWRNQVAEKKRQQAKAMLVQ